MYRVHRENEKAKQKITEEADHQKTSKVGKVAKVNKRYTGGAKRKHSNLMAEKKSNVRFHINQWKREMLGEFYFL